MSYGREDELAERYTAQYMVNLEVSHCDFCN